MWDVAMPGLKDFAALPTSWALTLWDALPLFLSIEAALAVVLVAACGPPTRRRLWQLTGAYPLSGIAYLALFDLQLALCMSVVTALALVVRARSDSMDSGGSAPRHPLAALRVRGGAVLGDVAIAGAVAAVIKIILMPELASGSPGWFAVGLAAGFLTPGPLGVAAIPALAVGSAADSFVPACVALVAAAARPHAWERVRGARRSRHGPAAVNSR